MKGVQLATAVEVGGAICKALGLSPFCVRSLVIRLEVGNLVEIEVEAYPGLESAQGFVGELEALTTRYTMVPISEPNKPSKE